MNRLVTVILLFTTIIVLKPVIARVPCTDPAGRSGLCRPLSYCDSLSTLFNKEVLNPEEYKYLLDSKCLNYNSDPVASTDVCCAEDVSDEFWFGLKQTDNLCGYTVDGYELFMSAKNEMSPHDHPWVALLQYTDEYRCLGSLIDDQHILTAAHCVTGNPKLTGIRLGEWDLEADEYCDKLLGCLNPVVDIGIDKIIIHEDFVASRGRSQGHNDIAIIRLEQAVNFTNYIKPICLPSVPELQRESFHGKKLKIVGWDRTSDTKKIVRYKTQGDIRGLGVDQCQKIFTKYRSIIDTQICGLANSVINDPCTGYSGGPVMRFYEGQYYLSGIISYGPVECDLLDVPDVFTRVAKYLNWIKIKTQT